MDTLREYLYVDTHRLDRYAEQISSGITYDKVPEWKGSLSLTGPVVGREQSSHQRTLTQHEKIQLLLDYLQGKGKKYLLKGRGVNTGYMSFPTTERVFRLEKNCLSVKVRMAWPRAPKASNHITLWISEEIDPADREPLDPRVATVYQELREQNNVESEGTGNMLLLLADSLRPDETCYPSHSAYSTFLELLTEAGQPDSGPLADLAVSARRAADVEDSNHPLDVLRTLAKAGMKREETALRTFFLSPISFFEAVGAEIASPRRIKVLYRVRTIGTDPVRPGLSISTFGYPIFIAT